MRNYVGNFFSTSLGFSYSGRHVRFSRWNVVFLFCLFIFSQDRLGLRAETWEVGRAKRDFGSVQLQGTEVFRGLDESYDIRLQPLSYQGSRDNLLYLDFESSRPLFLRNTQGHFRVHRALYLPAASSYNKTRAALFNGPDHGVWLSADIWSGEQPMHDFTIEMWFRPKILFHRMFLLEKQGFVGKIPTALEIGIKGERLFVNLQRLFKDTANRRYSVHLESYEKVQLDKWHHLTFTYQAVSGRLALYLNGKEQDVGFAKNAKQVWSMQFQKASHTPIILATDFVGLLDEVRIARGVLSPEEGQLNLSSYPALQYNLETQQDKQAKGKVVSSLLALPLIERAYSAHLMYQAEIPQGTSLYLYVRHAETVFDPEGRNYSCLATCERKA